MLGSESRRGARAPSPLPAASTPRSRDALAARGIEHALHPSGRGLRGRGAERSHVLVATGTASGKTPRVQPPGARRARGQTRSYAPSTSTRRRRSPRIRRARWPGSGVPRLRAAIYDGDTEPERRWQIRKWANVDPHEPRHAQRRHPAPPRPLGRRAPQPPLRRRRRGARLPRRLRLARRRTSFGGCAALPPSTAREPQFLLASATIGNPGELGAVAPRRAVTVVDDDGAPRAERTIALWNPPLLDAELGQRASALGEASRLLAVARRARTCARSASRRAARQPSSSTASRASGSTARSPSRLSPYRAGYTPGPAARDRAAPGRRGAARRHRDRRARARDRRRPARLRHLGRLSRDRCEPPPAVGPGRPARGGPRRARSRARTRSTSSSCGSRSALLGGASRRRSSTTRTRASSTGTSVRRPSRRRSRTPTARSSASRRSSARRRSPRPAS